MKQHPCSPPRGPPHQHHPVCKAARPSTPKRSAAQPCAPRGLFTEGLAWPTAPANQPHVHKGSWASVPRPCLAVTHRPPAWPTLRIVPVPSRPSSNFNRNMSECWIPLSTSFLTLCKESRVRCVRTSWVPSRDPADPQAGLYFHIEVTWESGL